MGAWVETAQDGVTALVEESHPLWVRGLKQLYVDLSYLVDGVASFMGAWVETLMSLLVLSLYIVASFMGAWVET